MKKFKFLISLGCLLLVSSNVFGDAVGFRTTIGQIVPIIENSLRIIEEKFEKNNGADMTKAIELIQTNSHFLLKNATLTSDYKLVIKFRPDIQYNTRIQGIESYRPYYLQNKSIVFVPNIITLNFIANKNLGIYSLVSSGSDHGKNEKHDDEDENENEDNKHKNNRNNGNDSNNGNNENNGNNRNNGNDGNNGNNGNNGTPETKKVISGFECVTNIDDKMRLIAGDIGSKKGARSMLAHIMKNSDSKYLGNCIYVGDDVINNLLN